MHFTIFLLHWNDSSFSLLSQNKAIPLSGKFRAGGRRVADPAAGGWAGHPIEPGQPGSMGPLSPGSAPRGWASPRAALPCREEMLLEF